MRADESNSEPYGEYNYESGGFDRVEFNNNIPSFHYRTDKVDH